MLKKLILLSVVFLGTFVNAQSYSEAILSFSANIAVNTDNSINVEETVVYDSGNSSRHGIYRDIYRYSSTKRKMEIKDISVVDEFGRPYIFETSDQGSNIRIKIGDPNSTFIGQKTYLIRYRATNAVGQLEGLDEIYWNVTGNEWEMPIYQASAVISLPNGTEATQSACYYGLKGATNSCGEAGISNNAYTFSFPEVLGAKEGLTIAVGFPKGAVSTYPPPTFFEKYLVWIVSLGLPILSIVFSFNYWRKKGRDEKGTGVIIPQYDVLDDLTPMEVAAIVNERLSGKDISAEIIYLATKGYLKINQIEEKVLGLIKQTDYELEKLKDYADLPNGFDRKIVQSLFEKQNFNLRSFFKELAVNKKPDPLKFIEKDDNSRVRISDLKNSFYIHVSEIGKSVFNRLLKEGYYRNLGPASPGSNKRAIIPLAGFLSFFMALCFGFPVGSLINNGNPLPVVLSTLVSGASIIIAILLSSAKSRKGALAKEHILGLKDYLQIAEKDRLKFHNAPEKKPETFEKLLPFAMVLGVADIWAKEFEGIYQTPPSWYSGPTNAGFNALMFTRSLSNFSSFASSSLSSSPSSSGSGGGGSSGGGGGGGGGGSW